MHKSATGDKNRTRSGTQNQTLCTRVPGREKGEDGGGRWVTKEVRSGGGERGVKCNILILSVLDKRGVSKTGTPLLCTRLYFNILHFTLEIGSGAGTTAAAAAGFAGGGRRVTKEVRSGEIGFCTRSDFIQGTLCINRPQETKTAQGPAPKIRPCAPHAPRKESRQGPSRLGNLLQYA